MAIWKAKTKDGKEVSEIDTKWEGIKDNVSELLMITNSNQIIYLPKKMEKYIQFKTASAALGSKNVEIESRVIGCSVGNTIVKVRVNEKTNNITIEVE
jgi:hypothetical protein